MVKEKKSFLDFIFKFTFLNRQNRYINTEAKLALHKIITSLGSAIYFPKTPEVLIKRVANSNRDKFLLCEFSIRFWLIFVKLFLQNLF